VASRLSRREYIARSWHLTHAPSANSTNPAD
jgi:hypothetical protein